MSRVERVGAGIEVLLVVAVGGMLWAALGQLRRGQVSVPRCPGCGRAVSRVAPSCRRCGRPL